jgi:possible capsular polysaccharide related protein
MKKVLFFSEVKLSPALIAKCVLLNEKGIDVYVHEGDKGEFYQNKELKNRYKYLNQNEIKNLKDFSIYVYGIRILIEKFFLIYSLKRNNRIVVEVADLPLRYGKIKNFFYYMIFNFLIFILSDRLVLTSEYFQEYLIKKPTYIFENLPSEESIANFLSIESKLIDKEKINIGYVGGLRYFEQLNLLVRYACNHKNVNIHFYGEEINDSTKGKLKKIIEEEIKKYGNNNNIFQHGRFSYEKEIKNIYSELDIIYSVYDERQLNVRLALPNKLYETILSRKIILVAENTKLLKEVEKYNVGYGISSKLDNYAKFEKQLSNILKNVISFNHNEIKVQEILDKIERQKSGLEDFLVGR